MGKLRHSLDVNAFSANPFLWLFAPSAPMLITNQLGVMKPSYGLNLCSKILEILRTNKYIITPINSVIKRARIDFVWVQDQTIMLQYFPKHALFHNDNSLEEGSRQLVVNYFYYIFSKLQKYGKLAAKSFSIIGMNEYLDFLDGQLQERKIGEGRDKWYQEFVHFSQKTNYLISSNYIAPDEWPEDEEDKNEVWANEMRNIVKEEFPKIDTKLHKISKQMGIT